jgi:hypothetical protein
MEQIPQKGTFTATRRSMSLAPGKSMVVKLTDQRRKRSSAVGHLMEQKTAVAAWAEEPDDNVDTRRKTLASESSQLESCNI